MANINSLTSSPSAMFHQDGDAAKLSPNVAGSSMSYYYIHAMSIR